MLFRIVFPIAALALLAISSGGRPTFGTVPCHVTMPDATDGCGSPFAQGVVDGQWVGLIFHFSGSNGGADQLLPITVGRGGNGLLTIAMPAIKPEGTYGDRMDAWFANSKLYVMNSIYLPGEAHCCNTQITARRYGFNPKGLHLEHTVTLPAASTHVQIAIALAKAAL